MGGYKVALNQRVQAAREPGLANAIWNINHCLEYFLQHSLCRVCCCSVMWHTWKMTSRALKLDPCSERCRGWIPTSNECDGHCDRTWMHSELGLPNSGISVGRYHVPRHPRPLKATPRVHKIQVRGSLIACTHSWQGESCWISPNCSIFNHIL